MKEYQLRREKLAHQLGDHAIILPARPVFLRNRDVAYPYRQDSHVFYFTGYEEQESIFLMVNSKSYMFVAPKDPLKELWDGKRWGVEEAQSHFGFDECFENHTFLEKAAELLKGCEKIYYSFDVNSDFDPIMLSLLKKLRQNIGRRGESLADISDPEHLIGEMRLFKSEEEIKALKEANRISSYAHREVMAHTRAGISERALHGIFIKSIMSEGAQREGYTGIFASGANATCLHYIQNNKTLEQKDWLLVDAGGEYNYYTADITRSFPVEGKFEGLRREIYEGLLSAQKQLVSLVGPGQTFKDLQKKAQILISEILKTHGILKESLDEILEQRLFFKYFPHGLGHWLGSDVHDVGAVEIKGESRLFEPSQVFTVEPGIYIPENDQQAPEELRGFGIRIEDDVLVTKTGVENLSLEAPKEVKDLEALIGSA